MFYAYVFFLIASGVLMLVMGILRAPYARRSRVLNLIMGAGFAIYGLYLLLFFQGGHYILFFYAFVLPVLMTVRFFRARSAYQAAQSMTPGAPAGYGQPPARLRPASGRVRPAGRLRAASGRVRPARAGYGQPPAGYGQPGGYGQPPAGYGQPGGYGQQPPFQP